MFSSVGRAAFIVHTLVAVTSKECCRLELLQFLMPGKQRVEGSSPSAPAKTFAMKITGSFQYQIHPDVDMVCNQFD